MREIDQPRTKELPEIKRFSPEAKEALEKRGYVIYELTTGSIKVLLRSLREGGQPPSGEDIDCLRSDNLVSRRSQVAIDPKHLLLSGSNRKSYDKQEEMMRNFSRKLRREIKGVRAEIGQVLDYTELVFEHFKTTGEHLFSQYGDQKIRTKTLMIDSLGLDIGFSDKDVLRITYSHVGNGWAYLWIAPLVVPQ